MPLSVIFMGTPDFAVPTLLEIVGQGHEVVACYTQPPRPAGRGMAERPSPVHQAADSFGIPVHTPRSLKDPDVQTAFADLGADVAVVVAYGLLLPDPILKAPAQGCLNLHASLLPRWRGAAPINRAIMAGDAQSGVMVMQMEQGLDTGPVALAESIDIEPAMTAGDLHDVLARLGADLMARALGALERGGLTFTPQSEVGVTYARKIDKGEARIDWARPAAEVHNQIRGLSPFPGAWCEMTIGGKPQRVKILRSELTEGSAKPGTVLNEDLKIACAAGAVRLIELQRAGKGRMGAAEFQRGAALSPGDTVT